MASLNRRLRVGHLITNFAVGGAQDYLFMVIRGLDQAIFDPIIMGRDEGDWAERARTIDGVRFQDIPSLRRRISPWHDLRAVLEVRTYCRRLQLDVLHTHSSKPGVVGRLGAYLAGVPVVIHTVHGFPFHNFMPSWKRKLFVATERAMSQYTTRLLVYSNADAQTAGSLKIGTPRSIAMFYYGVDYTPFEANIDRVKVRQALGFDDSHYIIGFTGRFSDQKALHILIKAFAKVAKQHPDARLLLVGDGSLRHDLEALAATLGVLDRILITGFRSDIVPMLKAMDLFVMTSLWEGLSRSLAEAMYARLPVVATDVGGTSDAVRNDETGWLIAPNSVDDTVAAILEARQKPSMARIFAGAGHAWAIKAFDIATMHKKIAALYLDLFSGKKGQLT